MEALFSILSTILVQFILLIYFIKISFKKETTSMLLTGCHLLAANICYFIDFQPWIIILFALLWLISGYFLFKSRHYHDLNIQKKIALFCFIIIYIIAWTEMFHERVIYSGDSGLFDMPLITNIVIDENYTMQCRKASGRPYYYKRLINKKGWILQRHTKLFPAYDNQKLRAEDIEWLPLNGDSVKIIIPRFSEKRNSVVTYRKDSVTIYLPDY